MTATTHSTALATIQPSFTDAERLALAGFLAGYRGLTRDAYTLDLRQFSGWCRARSLSLFSVRRADIETFAPGSWRRSAVPAPQSPGGSAPSLGSTSTRSKKSSSSTRPRRTSAGRGWTTSPGRAAAGPARRRPDRPPGHPSRRDRQAREPAHAAARVHHCRARRRGPAAGRAGGRLPCRPAHHHALRPGADQPGLARHLYCCRVHRRSSQISPFHRICLAALGGLANPSLGAQLLRSSNVHPTHP